MTNSNYSTTIYIEERERSNGRLVFVSKDLPGFIQIGTDRAVMRQKTPAMIQEYYRKQFEMTVSVRPWVEPEKMRGSSVPEESFWDRWSIFPQDLAYGAC